MKGKPPVPYQVSPYGQNAVGYRHTPVKIQLNYNYCMPTECQKGKGGGREEGNSREKKRILLKLLM